MIQWHIYSFKIPLISGGIRDGLILQINQGGEKKWGEIAPLPGRSRETLKQAMDQLLRILTRSKIEEDLLPSVQCGLEGVFSSSYSSTKVPLYAFLNGTPEQILQRAELAFAKGYTVIKIKVSSLAIADAISLLDSLKDRFRLRVDCNSAFSFEEVVSLFSYFDPKHFDYIEDPTFEMSRLADIPFPFALDENVSEYLSLPISTYPYLYGFILKPTILGGKKGCAPFVEFAKKNNLKIVFSPSFESGLGLLQILSVARHFNLLADPLGLDTHRCLAQDLLSTPINFDTPELTVTSFPELNTHLMQEIAHGTCELPSL